MYVIRSVLHRIRSAQQLHPSCRYYSCRLSQQLCKEGGSMMGPLLQLQPCPALPRPGQARPCALTPLAECRTAVGVPSLSPSLSPQGRARTRSTVPILGGNSTSASVQHHAPTPAVDQACCEPPPPPPPPYLPPAPCRRRCPQLPRPAHYNARAAAAGTLWRSHGQLALRPLSER